MIKKYKFFDKDIVKFKYKKCTMYYKVIKGPENIFTTNYDLLPWEVYENSINRGWDWNKLTKIKTKYSNNIFNYYLFRLYKDIKRKNNEQL